MQNISMSMFNSNNDNKSFSLASIIEEQLSNLSLGATALGLENDNNDLNIEEGSSLDTASSLSDPSNGTSTEKKNWDAEVGPLNLNETRWFYKITNSKWINLGGYDTLQLEAGYRKLPLAMQIPQKRDSPSKPLSPTVTSFKNAETNENDAQQGTSYPRVLVRGGLYEVEMLTRTGTSIYWPGEEFVVTRGTWFYEGTWQPLDEEVSFVLETVHMSLFQGKKASEFKLDTQPKAIHTEAFSDFHVDWYAPDEVYLFSQATPSKIVRSFTQKLGGYFQKTTGSKLVRGFKQLATDSDKPMDITHLVFVVHGIGQKMNIGAQIFRNTTLIREKISNLKKKYFPECKQRVEFFPVEWRSNLTLDGGVVDAITPLHVKMLRQVLNTSAMDIMYYTSPIYCSEIQDGLVAEMNRLYSIFCEKNTYNPPKVSVIAHSLGAVIVYDVVTGWLPNMSQEDVIIPGKSRLNFELDNFFCLGSPLSVFLAVRVPKGHHGYHLFPPSLCNRLYNIFHLTDPVAYRLEPLIVKDYARISPLVIHPYNAVRPVPYSEMPLEPLDLDTGGPLSVQNKLEDPSILNTSPSETPSRERGWSIWNLVRGGDKRNSDNGNSGSPHHSESPTQGLEHRLDYVLTSGAAGPLVVRSVLISHTAYWSNYDVAFFVLTRIFPELELSIPDPPPTSSSFASTAATVLSKY